MTQIGESVFAGVADKWKDEGTCVFCGEAHENRKEEIKPTGWTRKKISGVGGHFADKKQGLYPNPMNYRAEGHHCLAFSSFIVDARNSPKDRYAPLNHYLKEQDYDPNNINNTIDLPGRKEEGNLDEYAQFKEFEIAVHEGYPLQLHIGGHAKEFMTQSNLLLQDSYNALVDDELCSEPEKTFKEELLKEIEAQEDKAFVLTAKAEKPWVCHPDQLPKAEKYVKEKYNITEIIYPDLK